MKKKAQFEDGPDYDEDERRNTRWLAGYDYETQSKIPKGDHLMKRKRCPKCHELFKPQGLGPHVKHCSGENEQNDKSPAKTFTVPFKVQFNADGTYQFITQTTEKTQRREILESIRKELLSL